MSWFEKLIPSKIRTTVRSRSVPEGVWAKCPACDSALYIAEFERNLYVCPKCDHHQRINARQRLEIFLDADDRIEIAPDVQPVDTLKFKDSKKYKDRITQAQKQTGEKDALLAMAGKVKDVPVVVVAFDFSFMGGSMGMYVGNAIIAAAEKAVELKRPLILFSAAGGARMQEGILSLMQMPRSTVAIQMLKEAGLPYIVVLTHPTTGGVTASYAMLGDVQIAEPGALICFAGPRVIEQTIREKLPEGFQRAEYLLNHGMLDRVIARTEMRDELITIVRMLMDLPPAVKGDLPAPTEEAAPEAPAEASEEAK